MPYTPEQRPRLRIMINYANGDETLWGNFSELVQGQPGPGDDYVPWQIQLVSDDVVRMYIYMYQQKIAITHKSSDVCLVGIVCWYMYMRMCMTSSLTSCICHGT